MSNKSDWTEESLKSHINNFNEIPNEKISEVVNYLNLRFPFSRYLKEQKLQKNAIRNNHIQSNILSNAKQLFPETISIDDIVTKEDALNDFAIILTAGGEGERLRKSLEEQGVDENDLRNFTKATFPLPNFYKNFGSLQTNLALISNLCTSQNINIPVIITTGPEGSTTASIIPKIISENNNSGLKDLKVIAQDDRLHLSLDGKITINRESFTPVTNPDETGGPIMKLKSNDNGESILEWLKNRGKKKIMVLQGTALYDPNLLLKMATASINYDGLGIGIAREKFPKDDPYGTFVLLSNNKSNQLKIIEQGVRNEETRKLINPTDNKYLPFNTGFYIFNINILEESDLPDYATPAKEILPTIEKAPKIGYAATDIISFAKKPAVLTIKSSSFAVIKNADDLMKLSALGEKFDLIKICKNIDLGIKS